MERGSDSNSLRETASTPPVEVPATPPGEVPSTPTIDTTQESIEWDEDYKKKVTGQTPSAKYGAFSESLRHSVPQHRVCAMFCGGTKCKYCHPANAKWTEEQMEVKGLFSNWVTDNILAMSRPTTKAIKEFSIIDQFKQHGIKSIINLQLPGEHASCGFGNEVEGFSYSPQLFMDSNVFFYNFGWPDYGIGSLSNILDMVKVTQFALSEGKVSVHCHAGLGRTGVLIACYLIYANRMDPHDVIHFIRSKRKGSIQTRSQIACIKEFADFLKPLRVIFSSIDLNINDFTLSQFLIRQKQCLHGEEARKLKSMPKMIFCCCERLLELAHRGHHHDFHKFDTYDVMRETAPKAFNNRSSGQVHTPPVLHQSRSSQQSLTSSTHVLKHIRSDTNLLADDVTGYTAVLPRRCNSQTSTFTESDSSLLGTPLSGSDTQLDYHAADEQTHKVALALAAHVYSDVVEEKVNQYKQLFNDDCEVAYHQINSEMDPQVISAIMWYWLDELREPILHAQDMPVMLEHMADPLTGLKKLDKGSMCTVECVFSLISRLEPLSTQLLEDVVCRALSTLTHQNMMLDVVNNSTHNTSIIKRTSNQSGLMRASVAQRLLVFSLGLLSALNERLHQTINKGKQLPEKCNNKRTKASFDVGDSDS